IVSSSSNSSVRRRVYRSGSWPGASRKSSGCHPEAAAIATRPPERLSTTDHSSAIRTGWCSGTTTLPARIPIRSVTAAIAAASTDGLGYRPPKSTKCRSGTQTAEKPCASPYRAHSISRSYLPDSAFEPSPEKKNRLKSIVEVSRRLRRRGAVGADRGSAIHGRRRPRCRSVRSSTARCSGLSAVIRSCSARIVSASLDTVTPQSHRRLLRGHGLDLTQQRLELVEPDGLHLLGADRGGDPVHRGGLEDDRHRQV